MKRIGIERGKSFDIDKLDPAVKKGLESAKEDALALMAWKVKSLARIANGWLMNTETKGVYGNYYLKHAIIAQLGLGANLQEDAVYPMVTVDESGKPLDGVNNYILHFDKGARRLSTPSGRSRYTGRIATPASTASPSAVGCLLSIIPMVRSTCIFRTRVRARTRRRTGFLRRRPRLTSPCASMLPKRMCWSESGTRHLFR
jgi:hypothetical protein